MSGDIVPLLKNYVKLHQEIEEAKATLSGLELRKAELEEMLIPLFERDGIQNMKIEGRVAYLHQQLFASAANGQEPLVDFLKSAGGEDMIKESVHAQTLSSWARELVKEAHDQGLVKEDATPEKALAAAIKSSHPKAAAKVGALKVFEKYSVRIRKGD